MVVSTRDGSLLAACNVNHLRAGSSKVVITIYAMIAGGAAELPSQLRGGVRVAEGEALAGEVAPAKVSTYIPA